MASLSFCDIAFLIFQNIDDKKTLWYASLMLNMYNLELCGYFVNEDGTFTPVFDEQNWANNGSIIHRLLQGPERHGDVQGSLLEFYLSEGYLSMCSDWLRSMTPGVLREIERQLWH
jgi:hypothetical protein